VPHHQPVEDLEREVRLEVRLAAAVEGDGHVEALHLLPQRVVGGVVPRPAVHAAGGEEHRLEAEPLDRAAGLGHRAGHVVGGDHPRAEHAVGRVGTEVGEPVVVGAGDGRGVLRLEAIGADGFHRVEAEHEQPAGREQHGEVEPLGVHGVDLRGRVPAARLGVGVDRVVVLPPAGLATVDPQRPHPAQAQHGVVLHPYAHVTGDLRQPDRCGVGERRVDVALPEVGGLHHVQVRIGDHVLLERVRHRRNLT
jgi:hypothetical protein